ncbi:MAG: VWA domain-containing protein [Acidobacteriota bacterium]|jgi:Ca-activated chloride channel family protein
MRFDHPELLWTLLAVPLLGLLALWVARRRRAALRRLGSVATLGRFSSAPGAEARALRLAVLLAGFGALSLALAGPQWGTRMQEVRRRGIDLVMVVDVSRSMLARDVRPSRLDQAKEALSELIDRLPDDRVGLVAFAGSAQVFCPLTLDHAAARIFLDILDPSMIPDPGTALSAAIRKGTALFDAGEQQYKVMVLFTDGEDQDTEPLDAAREAARAGVIVFSVGVGSPAGEPIPLTDGSGKVTDYVRDEEGQVVTSRLDSDLLEEISRITGGTYYPATPGQQELDRIAEEIGGMDRKELSSRLATNLEDRYQLPLLAALGLLGLDALLADRRRRVDA